MEDEKYGVDYEQIMAWYQVDGDGLQLGLIYCKQCRAFEWHYIYGGPDA